MESPSTDGSLHLSAVQAFGFEAEGRRQEAEGNPLFSSLLPSAVFFTSALCPLPSAFLQSHLT
ncbi:MAG: hypothetical protein KME27_13440 [Lyngbya sp. HA4199-MV5]|nr:hypothetical protein [Lyngbya sp. HA4199-MV5]